MRAALRTFWLVAAILICSNSFAQEQAAAARGAQTAATSKSEVRVRAATTDNVLTHASAVAGEVAGQPPRAAQGEGAVPEAADEEEGFKHSPAVQFVSRVTHLSLNAAYWLCVAINFAILAIAILFFMKSSLPAVFRGRTEQIKKGIEEARRTSEDAGRRLKEIEVRLSRLDSDISGMQQRAESEARAEEERIRASIEEEKQKILQAAEQEIGQAANAARRDLQKYAAELAVDIAKQRIKIDAAEDKSLISDFAEQLASHAPRNGNG